jgi:4-amino-4-deoxy-L-arabinose transferase-like glycosyltransferase
MRPGRWRLALAAIVAVGTTVRALHVTVVLRDVEPGLDAVWYTLQAGAIREGKGYVVPASLFTDELVPTAGFPPAYPAVQAVWRTVIGAELTQVRLLGTALAIVTIVATALIGRRVIGPRAGLVAAAVVAVDPFLVASDGAGMSEALSVPLVTVAVLLACRLLDRGLRPWGAVSLGAVCGVAALTRQDLLVMAPVFLVAVAAVGRTPDLRRRVLAAGLGLLVAAAVVVPWAVRNQQQVGSFTVATMSGPSALAGANCDPTYYGASIGSWEFSCVVPAQRFDLDEGGQSAVLQRAATSYARAHLSRRAVPLLLPPLLVVLTAAASHGNPRFSAIAHPMLAIGAAAIADAAVVRWRARSAPERNGAEPGDGSGEHVEDRVDVGRGGAPAE